MSTKKKIQNDVVVGEKILELTLKGKLNWKKVGEGCFRASVKKLKNNMAQLKSGKLEVEIASGGPDLYSMIFYNNGKTVRHGTTWNGSGHSHSQLYHRIWLLALNHNYNTDIMKVLGKFKK